jgi:hypothetical protein
MKQYGYLARVAEHGDEPPIKATPDPNPQEQEALAALHRKHHIAQRNIERVANPKNVSPRLAKMKQDAE